MIFSFHCQLLVAFFTFHVMVLILPIFLYIYLWPMHFLIDFHRGTLLAKLLLSFQMIMFWFIHFVLFLLQQLCVCFSLFVRSDVLEVSSSFFSPDVLLVCLLCDLKLSINYSIWKKDLLVDMFSPHEFVLWKCFFIYEWYTFTWINQSTNERMHAYAISVHQTFNSEWVREWKRRKKNNI